MTNRLKEKIVKRIRIEGPVTFEAFMDMALYDPEFGYYMTGEARIGREGDFYTSSHLHPVFGEMIGRQIEEIWKVMGRPDGFSVVEVGPGEGHLCDDMLRYLGNREIFEAMKCIVVDVTSRSGKRKESGHYSFPGKVEIVDSMTGLSGVSGCVVSNELIDAFPVHLIQVKDGLKEVYVDYDKDTFREETGPLSTNDISEYFRQNSIELPEGYRTEVNLRARNWLREVESMLSEGLVLTIDYGYNGREYYSDDRNRGTVMCYYKHNFNENPYQHIGQQDITAHVNFSSLKKWGEEMGMSTVGFCRQGAFLMSLGIDEEIKRIADGSADYLFELARIKRLILPQGLGDSHKVLAQYKGANNPKLKGFSISNQVRFL